MPICLLGHNKHKGVDPAARYIECISAGTKRIT